MMVQPFSNAVEKLKVGEISAPTKTNFGWHIIKLIDKKQKAKPSFETLKESIRAELSQSSMLDHIADLKNEAKVEYHIDMPLIKTTKTKLKTFMDYISPFAQNISELPEIKGLTLLLAVLECDIKTDDILKIVFDKKAHIACLYTLFYAICAC